MKPTDKDLSILRAFSVSGALTVPEIEKVLGIDGLRHDCEKLYGQHRLNADRAPGKEAIYTLSYRGRNTIGGKKPPEMGAMPMPRTARTSELYKPSPIHTRAGSDEFLKAPSRTGETLTQYRPPVSMCGEQVSRV